MGFKPRLGTSKPRTRKATVWTGGKTMAARPRHRLRIDVYGNRRRGFHREDQPYRRALRAVVGAGRGRRHFALLRFWVFEAFRESILAVASFSPSSVIFRPPMFAGTPEKTW